MKVRENMQLGVEFMSKLTRSKILIVAVLFVDNADVITEGSQAKIRMKKMLKMHDNLYSATKSKTEESKCK